MLSDRYLKLVLTVIALALAVIAARPWLSAPDSASAETALPKYGVPMPPTPAVRAAAAPRNSSSSALRSTAIRVRDPVASQRHHTDRRGAEAEMVVDQPEPALDDPEVRLDQLPQRQRHRGQRHCSG